MVISYSNIFLGDALVILFDEVQVFSSNIEARHLNDYPLTLSDPTDVLLSSLYDSLNEIASFGKMKRIFVCIAGSHGRLKNLLVLSPYSNDPYYEKLLPLPLFNASKVQKVNNISCRHF
jgi:hypothetical protein